MASRKTTNGQRVTDAGVNTIELIIILGVVGIIAAFAIPSLLRTRTSGNPSNASGGLRTVSTSQDVSPTALLNADLANDAQIFPADPNVNAGNPKISENESPTPTDRLSFQYDFFDRVSAGSCTGPVTVVRRDANGEEIAIELISLQLHSSDGVTVFGDQGCLTPSSAVDIPDGASTTEFYFRPVGVERGTITATASGYADATADFTTNERAARGIEATYVCDTTGDVTDLQVTMRITDASLAGEQINGFRMDAASQSPPIPAPDDGLPTINDGTADDWDCVVDGTLVGCAGTSPLTADTQTRFDLFFPTTNFTPPSTLTAELLRDGSLVTTVDILLTTTPR